MPRILKWVQHPDPTKLLVEFDMPKEDSGPVYMWTEQEAKDHSIRAIRDFLFDLGNQYIERRWPNAQS